MNPAVILALIGDLYAQIAALQNEREELTNQLRLLRVDQPSADEEPGDYWDDALANPTQ